MELHPSLVPAFGVATARERKADCDNAFNPLVDKMRKQTPTILAVFRHAKLEADKVEQG